MRVEDKKRVCAIILAAGSGLRMNSDRPKQNIEISGKTVLLHTVLSFEESRLTDSIVVVVRGEDLLSVKKELSPISKVVAVVSGGDSRLESARLGFLAAPESDFVAIHDAARCLITPEMIDTVIAAAQEYGAATAGCAVVDTVKICEGGMIKGTYPREKLFAATTPQVFLSQLYKKALENAENIGHITDDNMLVESIGAPIKCVDIGRTNLKITTKEDLDYAEYIISRRTEK